MKNTNESAAPGIILRTLIGGGRMQKEILDAIWEEMKRLDEINFQAGDVLDVKASIILVVLTLLGGLSTTVLSLQNTPETAKILQVFAVCGISIAVIYTLLALRPCNFQIPSKPGTWEDYIEKLSKEHNGHSEVVLREFNATRKRVYVKRIGTNKKIAEKKAAFNDRAFYTTASVICIDLVTLGVMMAHRYL
jgi:hypothetical protein